MSFKPKYNSTRSKVEPIPSGTYDARCFGVCELGSKEEFNKYKNATETATKLMLFFEIPELQIEWERDGQKVKTPRAMYPRFKVSMYETSKLRKFIQSWFGKSFKDDKEAYSFDFSKLIGHCAQISVELNESGYSNITTISPLHKSVKLEAQFNPSINYGIEDNRFSGGEWDKLYPWVQNIIKESLEYAELSENGTPVELPNVVEEEDDIPF